MEQIARNATGTDGFLAGKKYLIHDRDHLILASEEQLRYVLSEYLEYYHHERIHQGLNKIIEPQHQNPQGNIVCIERLGGLLKSYHRQAA